MLQRLREAQVGRASLHHPPPGWSTTLVRRLKLERTLEGHDGCVNTVHFSPCGQLLVSGSDDMQIFFWDWQLGTRLLHFHSGHHNNVFQARIMPHSSNGTVVTCAADGVVRVAHVPQGTSGGATVETRRLACHRGRAHKLALEPGSPHCFLSCGEDGEVRHFDLREPAGASRRLLACRTQRGRLELNSVHCHPGNSHFCVAGGDPFVRVYDLRHVPSPTTTPMAEPVRRLAPWHLRERHSLVTITCAVFSQSGQVLATYNDENIYLFASEEQQAGMAPGAAAQEGQPQSRRRPIDSVGGGGRGESKRGRSSNGSEGGSAAQRADRARTRGQRRREAAAAALAQAQSQRAASGAAAAAEAHASMRRLLDDSGEEGEGEGPIGPSAAPPTAAAAAAGHAGAPGADASWNDMLPQPRGSTAAQQQQQQQQQREGEEERKVGQGQVLAPAGPGHEGSSRGGGSRDQLLGSQSDSEYGNGDWGDEAEGSPPMWMGSGGNSGGGSSSSGGGSEQAVGAASEEKGDASEGGLAEADIEEEGGEEEEADVDLDEDDEDDEAEGFESSSEDEDEEFQDPGEPSLDVLVDEGDTIEATGGRLGATAGGGSRGAQLEGQQSDFVLQTYKGHRNYRTVKGVSFLGQHDEFVMSGSDCGHIYVWDAQSGAVLAVLKGDQDTVNCLEPHPSHLLTLATSGIEDTIKLWTPTAEEPQVLGASEEGLMRENERSQGEERRMFVSPQMLRILMRARQLGVVDDEDVEDSEEGEDSDGDGGMGGRRGDQCAIQ